MQNLLIHIGFHKTGTTWLQRELFAHPKRGFQAVQHPGYPDKGDAKAAGWAFTRTASPYFDARATQRAFRNANKTIEDGKIPVISNERLSGATLSGGYDSFEIARRLKAVFPEAKILIAVREQFSMILSTYQQYLTRGGAHKLKCLLDLPPHGAVPSFNVEHFKYDRLVGHYQMLFGAENVMVYAHETFQRDPKHVVQSIYKFAGQAVPEHTPPFDRKHNESRAAFIAQATRHLGPLLVSDPANGFSALAIQWDPELGKRVLAGLRDGLNIFIPKSLDRRAIEKNSELLIKRLGADYYTQSNEALAKLTGLHLRELGYAMRSIDPQEVPSPRQAFDNALWFWH